MDYSKEKEFLRFVFEQIDKRGIKYFEKDGLKIVGGRSRLDPNDLMPRDETYVSDEDLTNSEKYVHFEKPKPKVTVKTVDPYALRPEEKI